MINSVLFAAAQVTVPATPGWTPTVGLVMILCNLLALIFLWGEGRIAFSR